MNRFKEALALALGHWPLRVNATPQLRIFVHTLSSAEAVHDQSGMVGQFVDETQTGSLCTVST